MSTKVELARMTIDMPKVNHKKLKAIAAVMGMSMREIVLEAIATFVEKKKPKSEIRKAMDEARQRKDVFTTDNVEELFKKWAS